MSLVLSAGIILLRGIRVDPDRQEKLVAVQGKTFINEAVPLDGYSYVNCKFLNVTLAYGGRGFELNHNEFRGSKIVLLKEGPHMQAMGRLMHVLKAIGELSITVLDDHNNPVEFGSRFIDPEKRESDMSTSPTR